MSTVSIDEAVNGMMNRAERRARGIKRAKPGAGTIKHCHFAIKKVAEGMAGVLFEEMMSRNEIWAEFKRQHEGKTTKQLEGLFIAHLWPQMIDQARATLAGMLRSPAISEEQKEEIMDILVKDQTLVRGRKNPAQFLGNAQ